MKKIVSFVLFVMTLTVLRGQQQDLSSSTPGCDALFTYTADPLNPLSLIFTDQSAGQINSWQWNFGDGVTSVLQNPSHTYLTGGTYFVCLTVSGNGSVPCNDVLCIAITIHEPGMCVADFSYTFDPIDPLKAEFTDLSSGPVNRWHWSFGDGTSSDERNPVHQYTTTGKMAVCLTAYHDDSIAGCHDVKCDSVLINGSVSCIASYVYHLDSLNAEPLTYVFTNTSAGSSNSFRWEFSDGATYGTENVVHRFSETGTYKVCLHVERKSGPLVFCKDSTCEDIATPRYFNLGGHLFAGEIPINNPVSTGDTGIVYLYRATASTITRIDSMIVTYLGYYSFPKILAGSYLVKAFLTRGSTHYDGFIPAYYRESVSWLHAQKVNLYDSSDYASHIRLRKSASAGSGVGMITGRVIEEPDENSQEEISFAQVILFNDSDQPLFFDMTAEEGNFAFDNLPFGAYRLYVDYPGKYSTVTGVWIDEDNPVADSLELKLSDHNTSGFSERQDVTVNIGNVFPNPSEADIFLHLFAPTEHNIRIEVMSADGNLIYQDQVRVESGQSMVRIPASGFFPGVYLLKVSLGNGVVAKIQKLIRL